jgi:hypothetical protein
MVIDHPFRESQEKESGKAKDSIRSIRFDLIPNLHQSRASSLSHRSVRVSRCLLDQQVSIRRFESTSSYATTGSVFRVSRRAFEVSVIYEISSFPSFDAAIDLFFFSEWISRIDLRLLAVDGLEGDVAAVKRKEETETSAGASDVM